MTWDAVAMMVFALGWALGGLTFFLRMAMRKDKERMQAAGSAAQAQSDSR